MFEHKSLSESKVKMRPTPTRPKNARLQQLQDEIDKLALLVNEAKRQSDKIQAAADALGDSVFADLDAENSGLIAQDKRLRTRKAEN